MRKSGDAFISVAVNVYLSQKKDCSLGNNPFFSVGLLRLNKKSVAAATDF